MFKGFYNLTSGMLTHQQNLNVIANNMVNVSTAGYKQERYTATTFDEVMYSRVGNKDGMGEEIGEVSYIRAAGDIETDFTQGTLEPTGLPLDFAINGEGFFAVQTGGGVAYTRMGNFSLDEDGFLCLPGFGRVLGADRKEIRLTTDHVYGDAQGMIYYEDGTALAQLGVFSFANNANLQRDDNGFFTGNGAQQAQNTEIINGYLERSNSDLVKQMTDMMTFQRALQSAAQVSKMYDQLMTKATTEVGRM